MRNSSPSFWVLKNKTKFNKINVFNELDIKYLFIIDEKNLKLKENDFSSLQ